MARKRPAQADAPANPQTESKLLSLPPELRTIIWELVLHVEPASNGALILRELSDRNGEADEEEDGGEEEHHDVVSSTSRSSVLNLLLICRFILYEAAGIFYAQHPIAFHHYRLGFKHFAMEVRCPARLDGVQSLLLTASGLEYMTMICAAIGKHYRKLKILRLEVWTSEVRAKNELETLARERPLFKRAVRNFPACVEVFRVKFFLPNQNSRVRWSSDERLKFHTKAREVMEDASSVLPKATKAEVVGDSFML